MTEQDNNEKSDIDNHVVYITMDPETYSIPETVRLSTVANNLDQISRSRLGKDNSPLIACYSLMGIFTCIFLLLVIEKLMINISWN